ncbi:MAG: hypothetical protein GY742_04900 [Hyphomicrobiales bacterium]|nr:hypothetical protein [Hyphomicrobiales bacterium]
MSVLFNATFSLVAIFLLTACNNSSPMPTTMPEKQLWLTSQIEDFEPTVTETLGATSIGNKLLTFQEFEIDAAKTKVGIVYGTEEDNWNRVSKSLHVSPTSLIFAIHFELRKHLCKKFYSTNLHANSVAFSVVIRLGNDQNYRTNFTEGRCMSYI